MADRPAEMWRELLATFTEESREHAERLLELLERAGGSSGAALKPLLQEAMRAAHTLKGNAVAVGHNVLAKTAHALEDALATVTDEPDRIAPGQLELLLESAGSLQELLDAPHLEEVGRALATALAAGGGPAPGGREDAAVAARPERAAIRVPADRLERVMSYAGEMLVASGRMSERIESLRRLHDDLERLASESPSAAAGLAPVVARLDQILRADRRSAFEFEQLTLDLDLAIKRMRMTPLSSLSGFAARTVRNCAGQLAKQVAVQIETGDVEVDRPILEAMREPLMHLLRNSVDHGIEAVDERRRRGKPDAGRILIRAEARGSMVNLEVSDDGRGIDTDALVASALAQGLLREESSAELGREDRLELLFQAGTSTAGSVSEISGRGIGLYAVRRAVEVLGGTIQVSSSPTLGGATFSITLPTSVLSIAGLLVQAGGATFAVPIDFVERTLWVNASKLQQADGAPALALPGEGPLRLFWLSSLFGDRAARMTDRLTVLVVSRGGRRAGLVVDAVIGQQKLVTRQLPWNVGRVTGVSAATIMPDSTVAVVVDVSAIFEASAGRRTPVPAAAPKGRPRVLVADDSLTARTLARNILISAGYDVAVAVDGEEAWRRLREERFDVLVSDVRMPKMDGIELTRRLRADEALGRLPVVLLTSLGQKEEIAAGAEAGADEYIVKGSYDQTALLEALGRLL
jgi:two-component system chemotaxis sensor kinase CheA